MGGLVRAGCIVHCKGEGSFIAMENSSLSLLQSYMLRTIKIFHVFTHNASLITVLSLILFWTSCEYRNNFHSNFVLSTLAQYIFLQG